MSGDRWRVFFKENDQLPTKDGVKTGFPKKAYNAISKEKKSAKGKSLIFRIPILNLI